MTQRAAGGFHQDVPPRSVMFSFLVLCLAGLDQGEGVPHPKLALQVQGGAHRRQAALNHYSNAVTQHISLFHAVCGQDNCCVSPVVLDHLPCEPAAQRKHIQSLSNILAMIILARCCTASVTLWVVNTIAVCRLWFLITSHVNLQLKAGTFGSWAAECRRLCLQGAAQPV